MTLTIRTNNVPRDYSYGMEFSGKERKEMLEQFDYLSEEEFNQQSFINYKGYWYDLGEFMRIDDNEGELGKWQGYRSDSYFSGIVVRYVENNERVVMGTYCS